MTLRRYIILSLGAIMAATALGAQQKSDVEQSYYRVPMDIPILLSANFAELRANHFHAGIDIKTQGVEGHKVFAAAEGYVSRVGISPGGYGKTIYIAHPNGTTTVYAHLQMFSRQMERYVDDWRYTNKRHSGDIYFKPSQFPVVRGEQIGLSGNTGMSGGPHLHYEVRNGNQEPMNVVAKGYLAIRDNIPPQIIRLYSVGTDTVAGVPTDQKPTVIELRRDSAGIYSVAGSEPVNIPLNCYLLVETIDRKNDVTNKFGIYSIRERVDGELVFELKLDKFAFADTRYKHAVSYYPLQRISANEVFRLVRMRGNKLPVYGNVKNRGVIRSSFGQEREILIEVTDDSGNTSTVSFRAKAPYSVEVSPLSKSYDSLALIAHFDRAFNHSDSVASVTIPQGALYESLFYRQSVSGETSTIYKNLSASRKLYAPVCAIGEYDTPLHKSMTVSMRTDAPADMQSKLCLAYIDRSGKISSAGGSWAGGKVSANVRSMGRYTVVADTTPPRVVSSFADGADLTQAKQISFNVTDDFAGIWDFDGTIDGKWILFEWNIPQRKIIHNFDAARFDYTGNSHKLEITVADGKGNKTTWSGSFVR